ncbi:uncharacterized protein N7503_007983 [Penicillium pulvis]|uniref:uncharacterized protein n=1 Tax=Penicillium pulvis TaxID=1562058 RepID=UPI0025490A67|nr:uncharacterized protein N7503_007983 [Penicillium pulvis]KAJ5792005.1 hypothetical protein N7503_007983 [Penicillium pulvis]
MENKESKQATRRTVHRRVRTGCLTCKIRKVKCDETRPSCTRCESTGRKCDGYSSISQSSLSQLQPSLFPDTDSNCLRSLDRFYHSLESAFCLPLNYLFWSRIVARLIVEEPAARHATISLMSLYETTHQDPAFVQLPYDHGFSLRHYNFAMKEIRSLKSVQADQLDTLLIVCVLFACIEFTRRDINAAMTHIKYGIDLLNESRHVSRIGAILRYMSLTPIFTIQSLWTLPVLTNCPSYQTPEQLNSFIEVQGSINSIQYDAVQLARMKEQHRVSQLHSPDSLEEDMPHIVLQEQQRLNAAVESLRIKFADFRARLSIDPKFEHISCILQIRWLMLKIWVICLGEDDEVYDTCMDDFERLINYARKSQLLPTAPGFMLEVGLLPYLYFVIAKCRNLQLRLRALSLIQKGYNHNVDIFWDPSIIYRMSKRILRAEHGLEINDTHATILEALRDSPIFAEDFRLCHDFETWEADKRINLPSPKEMAARTGSIPASEALGVPEWKREQLEVVFSGI